MTQLAIGLEFRYTRQAITNIDGDGLRTDFNEMLNGVEFCFSNDLIPESLKCVDALVAMAIGLNRTIGFAVATGILGAIVDDSEQDPTFRGMIRMGY